MTNDHILSEATITYKVELDAFVVREKLGIAPVVLVARDEAITGKMPNLVVGPAIKKWMCTVLAQADRGELTDDRTCPLRIPINVLGATEEHLRTRPFAKSNEERTTTFSGTGQAAHGEGYHLRFHTVKGVKYDKLIVDDIVDEPPKAPPAKRRVVLVAVGVGCLLLLMYLCAAWVSEFITDMGEMPLTRWYVCKYLLAAIFTTWCGWRYLIRPVLRWWRARRMENK